jgi:hypothetical protein
VPAIPELGGVQRPGDARPTGGAARRNTYGNIHSRRDNQSGARKSFWMMDFNMGADRGGIPRQTRHLVSSFDNHAWNLGDLLLDERYLPTVMQQCWKGATRWRCVRVVTTARLGADQAASRWCH